MRSFKKSVIYAGFGGLLSVLALSGCSQKSDDERILKDINSASVHLTVGLKYVMANPKKDPAITALQDSLHTLMQKHPLDVNDIATLGKIAYQVKPYGEAEVSRGRKSDFQFISSLLQSADGELNVQQDHGITLAALYLLQLNPVAPLLITDNSMLYEAWMADNADFKNEHLNSLMRAAQAKTFAANEYCEFAQAQTAWLDAHPLKPVDINVLKETLNEMGALDRVATHAAPAAPILAAIILAPALIEITPGAARVFAHLETAKCLNKLEKRDESLQQQSAALKVLIQMGFPAADIAPFAAAIAYKRGDLKLCAAELNLAKTSQRFDARTQADLQALAANLENPNPDLLQRYFTDASTGLFIGNLINQRLIDAGAYTELARAVNLEQGAKLLQEMNRLNPSDAFKKASKLLN